MTQFCVLCIRKKVPAILIFIVFYLCTRLCLEYEAKGGGYLKAKDLRNNTTLPAIAYTKTVSNRRICYQFDNVPPEHCSVTGSCSSEPLHLDNRISRDRVHTVRFTGWSDPVPSGGTSLTASKIESYEIRVNKVLPSSSINTIDFTTNVLSITVNNATTAMTINVSSDKPNLYCLTLDVKDGADNVRQCRRFILVDETTFIETNPYRHFHFTTASPDTGMAWQTHHNAICLSWKEYFLNKFYYDYKLLNGVEADPHGLITGTYEQISGDLPVSGTPNVHGIVKYFVSWKLHDGRFTSEVEIPDFLNQTFCKNLPVKDGETYIFRVRPVDIIGNTYNESRTVFIDTSPPVFNELFIWNKREVGNGTFMIKNTEALHVHFESYDNHSGILALRWVFGMVKDAHASRETEISVGNAAMVTTLHNFNLL